MFREKRLIVKLYTVLHLIRQYSFCWQFLLLITWLLEADECICDHKCIGLFSTSPWQGHMGINEDLCVSFMADPTTTTLLGMSTPWLQENSVGSVMLHHCMWLCIQNANWPQCIQIWWKTPVQTGPRVFFCILRRLKPELLSVCADKVITWVVVSMRVCVCVFVGVYIATKPHLTLPKLMSLECSGEDLGFKCACQDMLMFPNVFKCSTPVILK